MGGTWQAVSGGIEAGETAWQAAIRELREEAGLIPAEFYRLPVVNTFYISADDTLWHAVPFCAIVDPAAVVVLNDEHDAARWVPRERAHQAFMWATDQQAIAELCKTILDGGEAKPYLRISIEKL
jgi:dATP pyrophosphohydrolase